VLRCSINTTSGNLDTTVDVLLVDVLITTDEQVEDMAKGRVYWLLDGFVL
jgi:hypothetical protein